MRSGLARFRGFLACTAVCGLLFAIPHEAARTVAAIAFILLAPALFVTASLDLVRDANARRAHGPLGSTLALMPFRGLIALFGIVSLLIGACVCAWVLHLSHVGSLPLLAAILLGVYGWKRVFWARQAMSIGGDMFRSALGARDETPRRESAKPESSDR